VSDSNIHVVTTTLKGNREPGSWDRVQVEKPLDGATLKAKFRTFVAYLEGLFDDADLSQGLRPSEFLLDEITFVAEVGPDGDFRLRGDCEGGAGGVRIVLRRRRTNKNADQHLLTSKPNEDELKVTLGSSVPSDTVKVDLVPESSLTANIMPQPLAVAIIG
jgi:hypothetical protein